MLPVFFAIKIENSNVESVFFNFHWGAVLLNGMWLVLLMFFSNAAAGRLLVLFTIFLVQAEIRSRNRKRSKKNSWLHIFGSKKEEQKPKNTKTSMKSANSTTHNISKVSDLSRNASLQRVGNKRPAQIARKPLVINGLTSYNDFEQSLMHHTAGSVPSASSPRNSSKKIDKSDLKTAIAADSLSNTKDSSYYIV
ncbi:hypothetical protein M3Y98_01164900 [Aphelenchoides besseyi]|nr:hypothetical protein M3Y98_01164900 [Aphelenchoides besseyi]